MDQTNGQNLKKKSTVKILQIFLMPFKCESQSGTENQMEREIFSHCDKNSTHNRHNQLLCHQHYTVVMVSIKIFELFCIFVLICTRGTRKM